jgi:hypothetical protein
VNALNAHGTLAGSGSHDQSVQLAACMCTTHTKVTHGRRQSIVERPEYAVLQFEHHQTSEQYGVAVLSVGLRAILSAVLLQQSDWAGCGGCNSGAVCRAECKTRTSQNVTLSQCITVCTYRSCTAWAMPSNAPCSAVQSIIAHRAAPKSPNKRC